MCIKFRDYLEDYLIPNIPYLVCCALVVIVGCLIQIFIIDPVISLIISAT